MNKILTKYSLYGFSVLAVLLPIIIQYQNTDFGSGQSISATIFPFLGLVMIALLWLHSLMGIWENWLREHIAFDWFVKHTATVILWCLLLHPILLLVAFSFNIADIYAYYGKTLIGLGIVSWLLLISYDITKPFKKYDVIGKNWQKILFISNLGFLLSFAHAIRANGVIETPLLKYLLIFYGITGTVGIVYTYIVAPLMKKSL